MLTERFHFERIGAQHNVGEFRSDNTFIDVFLWRHALREGQEDLSRTYILLDAAAADTSDAVAGFFSLKADAQWTTGLPGEETPRHLPVAELAFLARHRRYRGQRLGDVLLAQSFRIAVEAAEHIGIAGIYLGATSEGLKLYQRYGFLLFEGGHKRMFLPIRTIRAVVEAVESDAN